MLGHIVTHIHLEYLCNPLSIIILAITAAERMDCRSRPTIERCRHIGATRSSAPNELEMEAVYRDGDGKAIAVVGDGKALAGVQSYGALEKGRA